MTGSATGPAGLLDDPPPLEGIRTLDLSGAIGAYCTKLLADLGADVVKVEPPGGDELRGKPPFRDGVIGREASLAFAYYHANKRGITLDVTRDASLDLLAELGADADVIVLSPSPRARVAGFADGRLSWAGAQAVVCSVTPFGLTGPYRNWRATNLINSAMGGMLRSSTVTTGIVMPGQQAWDETSLHAAIAILAALGDGSPVGGQNIDISAHEVMASRDMSIERYFVYGQPPPGSTGGVGIPPTGTWNCRDGLLDIAAYQQGHWAAFLEMLDEPDELDEPALLDTTIRAELADSLKEIIGRLMAEREREDLFARGQAAGLPCAVLQTPAQFVEDIQVRERGCLVTTQSSALGTVVMPGPGFRATPPLHRVVRPAPTLGEHNQQVYIGELGRGPAEVTEWQATGLV
jgi:benzylsuccinate CoA-transferase BbsE subunit